MLLNLAFNCVAASYCPKGCKCIDRKSVSCNSVKKFDIISVDNHTEVLEISNTRLQSFDDPPNLTNLRTLLLVKTHLKRLVIGKRFKRLEVIFVNDATNLTFDNVKISAPNLKHLTLENCQLHSPVRKVDLAHVERIDLQDNKITSFDTNLFNISSASTLILSRNPLKEIKLIQPLRSLKELILDETMLQSYDSRNLSIPGLQTLSFANSKLKKITLTAGADNLTSLNLQRSHVNALMDDDLVLPNLLTLYLSGRSLKSFTICKGLRNLEYLSIGYTSISLFNTSGCNFERLRTIIVTGSAIQSIDLGGLADALEYLYAKDAKIEVHNLHKLSRLQVLEIYVKKELYLNGLYPNLTTLSIQNAHIHSINVTKTNFPSLVYLRLEYGSIETQVRMHDMVELNHAYFTGTRLSSISIRNLPKLTVLDLRETLLAEFDVGDGVANIENLDLAYSKLRSFHSIKYQLPKLGNLVLDGSSITSLILRDGFQSLSHLYVRNTGLTKIVHYDFDVPDLYLLNVSGSPIQSVNFGHKFKALIELDLSNTAILHFNASQFELPLLTHLHISYNELHTIDLTGLKSLEVLHVDHAFTYEFVADDSSPEGLKIQINNEAVRSIKFAEENEIIVTDLSIKDNFLEFFNTSIAPLNGLERLQIGGNELTFVDLTKFEYLHYVDIKSNNKNMSITLGTHEYQHMSLYADDNTAICDCQLIRQLQRYADFYDQRMCRKGYEDIDIDTCDEVEVKQEKRNDTAKILSKFST